MYKFGISNSRQDWQHPRPRHKPKIPPQNRPFHRAPALFFERLSLRRYHHIPPPWPAPVAGGFSRVFWKNMFGGDLRRDVWLKDKRMFDWSNSNLCIYATGLLFSSVTTLLGTFYNPQNGAVCQTAGAHRRARSLKLSQGQRVRVSTR